MLDFGARGLFVFQVGTTELQQPLLSEYANRLQSFEFSFGGGGGNILHIAQALLDRLRKRAVGRFGSGLG